MSIFSFFEILIDICSAFANSQTALSGNEAAHWQEITAAMAGLGRFTAVLSLFRRPHSGAGACEPFAEEGWTVPDMAAALHAPVSTLYRTVRELTQAGFLEQAGEACYRLGPAFIEYDRILRLSDPLVRHGRDVLNELVMQAGVPCAALLARLYNNEVMCVADEAAPGADFRSSYERGKPMPLTRGATSKVILAALPSRELAKFIGARDAQPQLRAELAAIRRNGYFATASEIDPGLAGIAAPVAIGDRGAAASLTLVVREAALDDATRRRLVLLVVSAASLLSETLMSENLTPEGNRANVQPSDTSVGKLSQPQISNQKTSRPKTLPTQTSASGSSNP